MSSAMISALAMQDSPLDDRHPDRLVRLGASGIASTHGFSGRWPLPLVWALPAGCAGASVSTRDPSGLHLKGYSVLDGSTSSSSHAPTGAPIQVGRSCTGLNSGPSIVAVPAQTSLSGPGSGVTMGVRSDHAGVRSELEEQPFEPGRLADRENDRQGTVGVLGHRLGRKRLRDPGRRRRGSSSSTRGSSGWGRNTSPATSSVGPGSKRLAGRADRADPVDAEHAVVASQLAVRTDVPLTGREEDGVGVDRVAS